MSRTFANVFKCLSKCHGHEVVPGMLKKGSATWMQTSKWQLQQSIIPHSPRTLLSSGKVAAWKAQFMFQNKLSTKALSLPFRPEFSGTPLIDLSDIPVFNVNYAESEKLVRKWRKEQLAAGVEISDTFVAALYV